MQSLPYIFLLSVAFPQVCLGQASETSNREEELERPTCVFSGIAWQGASIIGLGYFTEGKKDGEFIEVFLPNGGRSRKYAYYGDSPLTFYNRVEVEEEEEAKPDAVPLPEKGQSKGEDEEDKEIVYLPVVSTNVDQARKEIFLFFFKPDGADKAYNVKSIDFDPESFPAGSYWFFSRCKKPLSIQFGRDKGELAPLGQAMIKARLDEFGDLPIRVFEPKVGTLRKVYSTIWSYNPRIRTIVFMLPTPNGVKVRRIVDVVQEEKALGLRPPNNDEKKD